MNANEINAEPDMDKDQNQDVQDPSNKNPKRDIKVSESLPGLGAYIKAAKKYNSPQCTIKPQNFSIYQRDFIPRSLELFESLKEEEKINAEKMHKEMHKGASIVKHSSYQVKA